ncbi:hypothetical protein O181_052735 [Austropuccinia psidii MF-1]|uniref:Uncharacterized protein n=1 Tax=Austropuccinia psidii MF-1 TaxID=1389203 RepID=A0A9Q3E5I1_9BASI|nr:hypothetical protein [Austropuccinia psidii MF-1]
MLGTKLAFFIAYHPQTDGLSQTMIQTREDIIRRFCAYGTKDKHHEGYTHVWVTLLPETQLDYNTSQHSTTAKYFHDIWNKACVTAARCIAEAKEFNNKMYYKNHKEPEFREGDQVLVSTLNFNNLKGLNKRRDSFVEPLPIIILIGENAVEVKIIEEFYRKHPVFQISLVKNFHQTGENKFPSRNKNHSTQDIVKVKNSSGLVKRS